jgi:insulysin
VRDELVKFHTQYYSANLMTLAIISSHSLDELEAWSKLYFSDVKNKEVSLPSFLEEKPYTHENLG